MTQMHIGMVVATTLKKELRESEGNDGLCGSGHWQAIEAGVVLSPDNVAHSISLRGQTNKRREEREYRRRLGATLTPECDSDESSSPARIHSLSVE